MSENAEHSRREEVCFKCKKEKGSIPSRDSNFSSSNRGSRQLYCKDCFSSFISKTIKQNSLQKCKVPSQLPLTIAVSGGPNSLCLLHHFYQLRYVYSHLRGGLTRGGIPFNLLPFYLDESELILPHVDETNNNKKLEEYVDTMKRQFHTLECDILPSIPKKWKYSGIEEENGNSGGEDYLFEDQETIRVFRYSDFFSEKERQTLHDLLHDHNTLHLSLNEKDELYRRIKAKVLVECSRTLTLQYYQTHGEQNKGWGHLLLGENALRVGVRSLTSLVEGNGGDGYLQEGGFRSLKHFPSREAGTQQALLILTLRPLMTILPSEVLLFNRLFSIPNHGYTPQLTTLVNAYTNLKTRTNYAVLEEFLHVQLKCYKTLMFNVLNMTEKISFSHGEENPNWAYFLEGSFNEMTTDGDSKKNKTKQNKVTPKLADDNYQFLMQLPLHQIVPNDTEKKFCFFCGNAFHSTVQQSDEKRFKADDGAYASCYGVHSPAEHDGQQR
ncbi:cytoplasmic tRNA 2-thiolation protein 2 [Angomonas deanei]|uniref:Cytoplasmic tRNA 2-thiolation protein 2 n=1 Tax=Angomonas deanei TaxID=59799 RepID=A0A7G2CKH2_9TRYP|nr:cytoplasmic tRNA 2-thiolation protein 2 [Angomonas deanei]CAD2219577.1 hypothetical protein, conserved [Angomonas deanei]|eukprot:EPY29425.1 cytoplasmic tRNA 2-thiolation protein 2 [Angomonas deanei]